MRLLRYYRTLLGAELAATAAYRAQLIIGLFGWVVPFVMIALWRGAAESGPIEGITGAQFTSYFIVVLVVTATSVGGMLVFGLGGLVHSGRLSPLLLRPFHPVHTLVARQLAENLVRLIPLLLLAITTMIVLGGDVTTSAASWVLALLLHLIGIVLVAYLSAIVGAVSLWMTKSEGMQSLLFGIDWIAGGIVAPVLLLPFGLDTIARALPFWLATGAPAELVAGITPAREGVVALALAILWTGVMHVAFTLVWRRGMIRYEAVGT